MENLQTKEKPLPVEIQTKKTKKRPVFSEMSVYFWILPSLVLIISIVIIPVFELFHTSLVKVSQAGVIKNYNNFKNFTSLFVDGTFLMVLKNTLIWTVVVVGVSTVLSVGVAMVLNKNFRGRAFVRACIIFPWATSLIITAAIWKWMFDYNYGAINLILKQLHIIQKSIFWLAAPSTSFPIVMLAGIYVTVPFTAFVILSGLQSIPATLYESASIDGANGWYKFWHITLPLLKSALTMSTVLNIIYVFNSFPIIWTITRGEPLNQTDTIVTYLYKLAFTNQKIGQAAAVSVVGFLILVVFSIVYISLSMRREKE